SNGSSAGTHAVDGEVVATRFVEPVQQLELIRSRRDCLRYRRPRDVVHDDDASRSQLREIQREILLDVSTVVVSVDVDEIDAGIRQITCGIARRPTVDPANGAELAVVDGKIGRA